MLLISSIFSGILLSAVLISIVDINMKNFLKSKNIDVETHNVGLLIHVEQDGKDKAEYDKYIGKIYLIFIIITSIISYIVLPKL